MLVNKLMVVALVFAIVFAMMPQVAWAGEGALVCVDENVPETCVMKIAVTAGQPEMAEPVDDQAIAGTIGLPSGLVERPAALPQVSYQHAGGPGPIRTAE